jgi:hypothetical protein
MAIVRLDSVAHRVEPSGACGGQSVLRRRRRALRERLMEIPDDPGQVVGRSSGGERACCETTMEHWLPGVHDDPGAAGQKATDGLNGAHGPLRAVVCSDDRPLERPAAVRHDQQRHV